MPEILIKYKSKKSLAVLEDLSKHLDFKVIKLDKEKDSSFQKSNKLLKKIEAGLKDVQLIKEGKQEPITLDELINEL